MRLLLIILPTLLAAGCTGVADRTQPERDRQQLAAALAGRTAGAPLKCLPRTANGGTDAIGDSILFRDGNTTYVSHTGGSCGALSDVGKFLVLEHYGGSDTCAGDLAKVADSSGFVAGSCVLGPFVPYRR